jgi:hypothetical protein
MAPELKQTGYLRVVPPHPPPITSSVLKPDHKDAHLAGQPQAKNVCSVKNTADAMICESS